MALELKELKDIRHTDCSEGESLIHTWAFVEPDHGQVRVYYKPMEEEGDGFYFYAVEWTGAPSEGEVWTPETECATRFWGYGYIDGIRHMFMGHEQTEDEGYAYYPIMDRFIKTLEALKELEKKYCRDYWE